MQKIDRQKRNSNEQTKKDKDKQTNKRREGKKDKVDLKLSAKFAINKTILKRRIFNVLKARAQFNKVESNQN